MHNVDVPAGWMIRLVATARADSPGPHRWGVRVLAAGDRTAGSPARLSYGSRIGGADCEQRIDIPAQEVDCGLEIWASHASGDSWEEDPCTISVNTPTLLEIGFADPKSATAREDDVLLSFSFRSADGGA